MNAYTNSTGNALILLNFVTLLNFGRSRVIDLLHTHILLTTSELRSVDGDEETLDTTGFGMLDVLPGDFAVAVDVELEEEVLARRGIVDDIIEGA